MIEQFNFDIRLIFAILNGKVSAAINRKLYRNFRLNGLEISPEQWTVLIFLWEKDGVTQQELCNATFKDKPSMTRLIDNMERQHLVVRISDKKDRRTNLIHLTKDGKKKKKKARMYAGQHEQSDEAGAEDAASDGREQKRAGRKSAYHCRADVEGSASRHYPRRIEHRAGSIEKGILQHEGLSRETAL